MAGIWGWWAYLDLNQGPHPYQGCALTKLSYTPVGLGKPTHEPTQIDRRPTLHGGPPIERDAYLSGRHWQAGAAVGHGHETPGRERLHTGVEHRLSYDSATTFREA